MKLSDLLKDITLKFKGGGTLQLKKYIPYIIDEDIVIEDNSNEQEQQSSPNE